MEKFVTRFHAKEGQGSGLYGRGGPGYLGEIFVSFLSFQYLGPRRLFVVYVKVICIRDKVIPVSVRLSEFNGVFSTISI